MEGQAQRNRVFMLEGSALDVSVGQAMLIEPMGMAEPYKAKFVGMEKGDYLLARVSLGRLTGLSVSEEETITVKLMNAKGRIQGFQSVIRTRLKRPNPMLVMDFPYTIEVLSLRRHDRVLCYIPATVYADGEEHHGAIVDLSAGGCKFWSDQTQAARAAGRGAGRPDGRPAPLGKDGKPLPTCCALPKGLTTGAEVFCAFNMLGGGEPTYLAGSVANAFHENSKHSFGIAFRAVSEEVRQSIDGYVERVRDALAAS